ncbi:hypothetical protein KKG29_05445 [Patescibacteria group bacterium]|nr:hypothetical protein [Patescibacteria group bacterium]
MSWYGWIPIITSTLLVENVIRDIRRSSLSTETRNEHLLLPKINQAELIPLSGQDKQKYNRRFDQSTRATMRFHLNPASTDEVYYYLRDFDDKDTTNLHRVAVIVNNDGFVKKVALFGFSNPKLEALAVIENIETTGLMNYELIHGEPYTHAMQLFGEVRDIYHEHIYAPHGDFALQPVEIESNNKDEAIKKIFAQYQKKILLYHSLIKNMIHEVGDGYGIKSARNFENVSAILSSAKGEMVYARSFIRLFNLPENSMASINNSLESLNILTVRFNDLLLLRSLLSNTRIYIITLVATIYAALQLAKIVAPSYPVIFSFVSTIVVILLIGYHSHTTTKKRKIPKITLEL